jgi:hypothetical protein
MNVVQYVAFQDELEKIGVSDTTKYLGTGAAIGGGIGAGAYSGLTAQLVRDALKSNPGLTYAALDIKPGPGAARLARRAAILGGARIGGGIGALGGLMVGGGALGIKSILRRLKKRKKRKKK